MYGVWQAGRREQGASGASSALQHWAEGVQWEAMEQRVLEAVSKLNSSCFPVLLERQIAAAGVPLLGSPLLPFRPCVRACIPSPLSSLPSPLSPLHLVPALLLPTSNNSPRTRFQVWCDKFWCRAAKVDDAALVDLGDLALVDLGDHAYNAGPSGVCRHAFVVRRRNTCVTTRSSALCCRRCSSVRTAMPLLCALPCLPPAPASTPTNGNHLLWACVLLMQHA